MNQSITISGVLLSDLFFNHDHPHLDAMCDECGDDESPDHTRIFEAVAKDAKEFANTYGGDAELYAEDYMRRL
jgi:hypothetical protein